MSTFRRFENIDVWALGRELTRLVYESTQSAAFARDFGLRDQIQRAAVSITSNIAEGFERRSSAEFARGSAGEVRSQLYLALDLDYIDQNRFDSLTVLATRISRATDALARHLRDHPTRVYEPEADYGTPGPLYPEPRPPNPDP